MATVENETETEAAIENETTKKLCLEPETVENYDTLTSQTPLGFGWAGYSTTEIDGVKLPTARWQCQKITDLQECSSKRYYYDVVVKPNEAVIEKLAIVDFCTRTITYSVLSMGLFETPEELKSFTSIQHLEKLLSIFSSAKICPGIVTNKYLMINPHSVMDGDFNAGTWRATKYSEYYSVESLCS